MFKPKAISAAGNAGQSVHSVMRNQSGAVVVRHPALPGKDMMPASRDYAEVPFGSMSKHNQPGGINGGLAPFQSEQGAEGGEYANA